MNSIELNDNTHEGDYAAACNALYKWSISNCLHKSKVKSFDPITGQFRQIDVPCGECPHCKNTYRNEWYTRMYLHSLDYKYIYYITLTCASPDTADSIGCDFVVDKRGYKHPICIGSEYKAALLDMHSRAGSIFTKNGFNTHGRVARHPINNQALIQNFYKKLRSTTKADITFYYCSEYGHDFGKWHTHHIIWSDIPLSEMDIRYAWSRKYIFHNGAIVPYRGQKSEIKPFNVPFGHVDFNDLRNNGTFDNDCKDKQGKFVFSYVCKYLNKKEYNDVQVRDAFLQLPYVRLMRDANGEYHSWRDLVDFEKWQINVDDLLTYDKNEEHLQMDGDGENAKPCRYWNGRVYSLYEFIKVMRPYSRSSTGKAIGSRFADEYAEDFKRASFHIPSDLKGRSLVTPSYFVRKAKQYLFPFRVAVNSNDRSSRSIGNIQYQRNLLRSMAEFGTDVEDFTWTEPRDKWHAILRKAFSGNAKYTYDERHKFDDYCVDVASVPATNDNSLFNLRHACLYDVNNRQYYLPTIRDGCQNVEFVVLSYDKAKKKYYQDFTISAADLYLHYMRLSQDFIDFALKFRAIAEKNDEAFLQFQSRFDYPKLKIEVQERIDEQTHADQVKYDMLHNYLD